MAIKLSDKPSFSVIPEGVRVFKVTEVEYDAEFGSIEVTLHTKENQPIKINYSLLDGNGAENEKAVSAFTFFARNAMQNLTLKEVDEKQLVGKYVKANVVHNKVKSKKDSSKELVFPNLRDFEFASGFEGDKAVFADLDEL